MRTPWTSSRRARGLDLIVIAAIAAIIGVSAPPMIVAVAAIIASAAPTGSAKAGSPAPGLGTPTPIPPPPNPVPLAVVSGWSVDIIGDSLTVGAIRQLKAALPGIFIYARVGEQFSYGIGIAAGLKAQNMLRRIVIVDLGTNGTFTSGELTKLIAEVGPDRRLVLVNTFEQRPWEHHVNALLAAAARRYPNVVLADWYDAIRHRTYLLSADGYHPGPAGTLLWVRIVKAAVYRAASLVG
jgi:hypothetical protein